MTVDSNWQRARMAPTLSLLAVTLRYLVEEEGWSRRQQRGDKHRLLYQLLRGKSLFAISSVPSTALRTLYSHSCLCICGSHWNHHAAEWEGKFGPVEMITGQCLGSMSVTYPGAFHPSLSFIGAGWEDPLALVASRIWRTFIRT